MNPGNYLGETWLDPEEYTYPSGALRGSRRRARVRFPDGKLRIVYVGIPDTYFSIPAYGWYRGKTLSGYITTSEQEYIFEPARKYKNLFSKA